jgi:hypothetical protein
MFAAVTRGSFKLKKDKHMATTDDSYDAPRSSGKLEPGNWDGEYIDVNGYRGKLRLHLETGGGGAVSGKYEMTVRSEDGPQIFGGPIDGKVDDQGNVYLDVTLARGGKEKEGDKRHVVQYTARPSSAGSYAKQALFGSVGGSPETNFGGGVWIAWRFNRPEERW